MAWLKQSTAADVELGPCVDDTDFKTPETGLTLSQGDCLLIKNGGAAAQKNDATTATHLGGGHYKVPLNATDTNTLGRLRLYANESGALPVWRDFLVLPANVYDALVAGSDKLDVNAAEWLGTTIAAADTAGYPKVTIKDGTGTGEIDTAGGKVLLQDGAITAAVIATGAIDADAIADNAIDAGAIATGAITETKISSGGLNAIADAILKRDWTAVSGEAARSALNALRFLRNKFTVVGSTLTVYEEDDATTAWTGSVSTDAAADPITGNDPA